MIQKAGMFFFLIACVMLLSLLFISDFTLNEKAIKQSVREEQRGDITALFQQDLGKKYASSISFNRMLKGRLKSMNDAIVSKYNLSDENIKSLLSDLPDGEITYSFASLPDVLSNSEIGDYQKKQLESYTQFMEGKKFETKNDLYEQLSSTRTQINNNIVENLGYNNYKQKNLQLALTRASLTGPVIIHKARWLLLTFGLALIGSLLYILVNLRHKPGIKNNGIWFSPNSGRGWIAIIIGSLLILFYVILYWYPEYITPWMALVDPISRRLNGGPASQWFFYGLLYTLAIAVMGVRMLIKYRHSRYQMVRTLSVMFFQTAFAFLIPEILIRLNEPSMDLKNIWPLNYTFFFDYNIEQLSSAGVIGTSMLVWGIVLALIGVPVITYFFGKRWYCSWVCGCGGLAETLGDPYRQLSDKSVKAWKIERWLVHGVLVFAVLMTIGVLYTYFTGSGSIIGINTYTVRSVYGFVIGSAFAGVVGVGFYPLMGSRVWCRFGCPLAAYLGLVQRFKSRFRITTNGGQCISCGNCSTYCEMGIDVRWYAQRGQNIVRASCVGCGVCSSVCPRGVLNLENLEEKGRFGEAVLIGNNAGEINKN